MQGSSRQEDITAVDMHIKYMNTKYMKKNLKELDIEINKSTVAAVLSQ